MIGRVWVVLVLALAVGCSAEPDKQAGIHGGLVDLVEAYSPQPPRPEPTPAGVGSSIALRGNDGEAVRVTVVELVDPAPPRDRFSQPDTGFRLVAVQLQLENIGQTPYQDAPSNGANLIDAKGQQYSHTFRQVSPGQTLGGTHTISPGDSRLGYVVFDLPESAEAAKLQYALNSGYARHVGEWKLKP